METDRVDVDVLDNPPVGAGPEAAIYMRGFYDNRYLKKLHGSLERIRAFHQADNISLYRDLVRWGVLRNAMHVLDVGCGWAIHLDLISSDYEVTAVKTDLSSVALQALVRGEESVWENRTACAVADLEALPFAYNSFDLVLCSQVLEHTPDDIRALSECYRVLREQGILFIAVPNCFRDMYKIFHPLERVFDQSGHIHEYCIEDIRDRLLDAGFKIEKERYHSFFVFWFVALLERTWVERVVQRILVVVPLLEAVTRLVLAYLLLTENRLLGYRSRSSMSIEFVARKN